MLNVLITAGPTHEPIDSVRFIGNRSSGKVGIAIANAARRRNLDVVLLLGPVAASPAPEHGLAVHRFRTCDDLQTLLNAHIAAARLLIMAAAVADYRPKPNSAMQGGKFRRTNEPVRLELEPTPDLLAGVGEVKRPDQYFVGFALEPQDELIAAATSKLKRKRIDLIVANPLETMESDQINATLIDNSGVVAAPGMMSKVDFAEWFVDAVLARVTR